MLDQNTDRMWYVIGAVIIGAAIILILNGTAPELFASVADTFRDKTEEVTEVIDGIDPNTHENLLAAYENVEMHGGQRLNVDGTVTGSNKSEFLRFADLSPIFEKYGPDQTYTLSFDVKSLDTTAYDKIRVYMQTSSGSEYNFIDSTMSVTEEYSTHSFSGLKPTKAPNPYDYTTSHLAFFGGKTNADYGNGNVPVVRNVRLILEP